MIVAYLLCFAILLIAYLLYKWIIVPKKQMDHYAKLFKARGYKVLQKPYRPLSAPYYDQWF